MKHNQWLLPIVLGSTALPFSTLAETSDSAGPENETLETITVEGRKTNLIGDAISASEGIVGQEEISIRPLLRTGEVLELVPGMVVTQHSGTGKANQYFLRGFNLDHGTDFSTFVDGMPVNMRSHGHGQGYTDLNFLIPESVERLSYKKGSYYADVGDFSGAGHAAFSTFKKVEQGQVELTLGEDNYHRFVVLNDAKIAGGDTLYAFSHTGYDGPWTDIDEDLDKTNLLLKQTYELEDGFISAAFMAYDNTWNSADQIPGRAVESGLIDELGSIDTSVGGESSRYSLSVDWQQGQWQANAYAINYDMTLWSNFTYLLDDNIDGDQFEQVDDRTIWGGSLSYKLDEIKLSNGMAMNNLVGVELRKDDVADVGLFRTKERQRLGTIRRDSVDEFSLGAYWQNSIDWNERVRTVIGLRHDYYDFDVRDRVGNGATSTNINNVNLAANSGETDDSQTSLKANVIYSFNDAWEGYLSYGQGFHSNDARGTTIRIDPSNGEAVDAVDPLVKSTGYELGLRGYMSELFNVSIALWQLDLDSELLFVGDAGNTEASDASERHGLELTTYYYFNETLSVDLEYAYTEAKFAGNPEGGELIPGAPKHVVQAGVNVDIDEAWFGSFRVRYFGKRPLIEDGSVYSDASFISNLRVGYRDGPLTYKVDVLNLTNSNDHDIDYFYESQLASEMNPVEDVHYHVFEPRTIRLSVNYQF